MTKENFKFFFPHYPRKFFVFSTFFSRLLLKHIKQSFSFSRPCCWRISCKCDHQTKMFSTRQALRLWRPAPRFRGVQSLRTIHAAPPSYLQWTWRNLGQVASQREQELEALGFRPRYTPRDRMTETIQNANAAARSDFTPHVIKELPMILMPRAV